MAVNGDSCLCAHSRHTDAGAPSSCDRVSVVLRRRPCDGNRNGTADGSREWRLPDVVIREVTHSLPKGVVDQRIDWAAVLAGPFEANDVFAFPVVDPGTGISEVRARVLTSEHVSVPAGDFETVRVRYEIVQRKSRERYELWGSATPPRVLVKEVFPNGSTMELATIRRVETTGSAVTALRSEPRGMGPRAACE